MLRYLHSFRPCVSKLSLGTVRDSPFIVTRVFSSVTSQPAESAPNTSRTETAAAPPIPDPRNQRVLNVALAGLPNAGKSTLLNYMVGDKVRTSKHYLHGLKIQIDTMKVQGRASGVLLISHCPVMDSSTQGILCTPITDPARFCHFFPSLSTTL